MWVDRQNITALIPKLAASSYMSQNFTDRLSAYLQRKPKSKETPESKKQPCIIQCTDLYVIDKTLGLVCLNQCMLDESKKRKQSAKK